MKSITLTAFLYVLISVNVSAQQPWTLSVCSEDPIISPYTTSIRCLGVTDTVDNYFYDANFKNSWFLDSFDDSWWDVPVMYPSNWCLTCGIWPIDWGINSVAVPLWAPMHPDSMPGSGMYYRHKFSMPNCSVDSARLYLSIDDDVFKPDPHYPRSYHGLFISGVYIDLTWIDIPDNHEDRIEVLLTPAQRQGLVVGGSNLIAFFAKDGWRQLHRAIRYELRIWMSCPPVEIPTLCADTLDVSPCWHHSVDDQFSLLSDPFVINHGDPIPIDYVNGAYYYWPNGGSGTAASWRSEPAGGIADRVFSVADYQFGTITMSTYCNPFTTTFDDLWFDNKMKYQTLIGRPLVDTLNPSFFMTGLVEPQKCGVNIWYGPFMEMTINDISGGVRYLSSYSWIVPQPDPASGGVLYRPFGSNTPLDISLPGSIMDSTPNVNLQPMRFCATYSLIFTDYDGSTRTVKVRPIGNVKWTRGQSSWSHMVDASSVITLYVPFTIEHLRGVLNNAGKAHFGDIFVGAK